MSIATPLLAMHTFIQDGHVFISPNMSIPSPAIIESAIKEESDALDNAHKFCVMSPNYPQLPFTLRYRLCYGPLFSCLSYSYKSLPIVRINTLYQLEPKLLAWWDALDRFLTAVTHGLQMLAPMHVVLHLVPWEANYTRPQKSEKAACGAASYAL